MRPISKSFGSGLIVLALVVGMLEPVGTELQGHGSRVIMSGVMRRSSLIRTSLLGRLAHAGRGDGRGRAPASPGSEVGARGHNDGGDRGFGVSATSLKTICLTGLTVAIELHHPHANVTQSLLLQASRWSLQSAHRVPHHFPGG